MSNNINYIEFHKQFKSIVWLKGESKIAENFAMRLSRYDKGGSHAKAINKALEKLIEIRLKLKDKLSGRTYEEWLAHSKLITKTKQSLKNTRNPITQLKHEKKLENLLFTVNKKS